MHTPPLAGADRGLRPRAGLLLGPILFAAMLLAPAPDGLSAAGWRAAAVGALMAAWWVTEAVPIAATALLPLPLFPLLGVAKIDAAAAPYANPLIFLFMGGFLLALAMQRWELHRRIALGVVRAMGTRPAHLVGGFMAATALISMWVSNTATAVMMLPIGISVTELVLPKGGEGKAGEEERGFAAALMLGIAYAASIGGFATLIGTPPNALLAGFVREPYGREIGFGEWMLVGVPLMLLVLPLTWLLLVRGAFRVRAPEIPGGRELIEREIAGLGPMSRPEWTVLAVFGAAAVLWVVHPFLRGWVPEGALSDAGIGVGAALLLFVLPAGRARGGFVLDAGAFARLPWEVLLLFGGGLSLADALTGTGVAKWIGAALGGVGALPLPLVVAVVCAVIVLLSEVASNTAVAAALLPVVGSLALGIGQDPLLLAIPAALAASCGFMLPVATPPNAIAYGTGHVTVPQMARAGAWLDAICVAAILAVAYTTMLWAFEIRIGVVPPWAR
jgi:sodium-dependent dicarboxylate transporter 2/3/5